MHLLLCAATSAEINPTIEVVKQTGLQKVEVLITGVGLMAATYALTKYLCSHKPGLVIQAGVSGSFDPGLNIGNVVAVEKDAVGDEGVWEEGRFKNLSQLGFINTGTDNEGWLMNPHSVLKEIQLPRVAAVTVNTITTDKKIIAHYQNIGTAVESMEGAALHFVCGQLQVPFLQLRAISNFVGERDKKAWNLPLAIANLNVTLQQIFNQYVHA